MVSVFNYHFSSPQNLHILSGDRILTSAFAIQEQYLGRNLSTPKHHHIKRNFLTQFIRHLRMSQWQVSKQKLLSAYNFYFIDLLTKPDNEIIGSTFGHTNRIFERTWITPGILFVNPDDLLGLKHTSKWICTAKRNACFLNMHPKNRESLQPQQNFKEQCPRMKNIFCESIQFGLNSLKSTELSSLHWLVVWPLLLSVLHQVS